MVCAVQLFGVHVVVSAEQLLPSPASSQKEPEKFMSGGKGS